jgi:tetratricopeptide (TPR) repeat protein
MPARADNRSLTPWASFIAGSLVAGGLLVAPALLTPVAHAEDVVLLKPGGASGSPRRITGTITEYTGREIMIRTAGGRETMLPADRVVEIATEYSAKQIEADDLFAKQQFEKALVAYQHALREETRTWVKREILAQMAWCLREQDQWDKAAALFLSIVKSDPATQHFDAMPLAWRPQTLSPGMERFAQAALADKGEPIARLIAASWLLSGAPEQRTGALDTLEQLADDRDPRIAQLAEAQRWRTQLVTAVASDTITWQTALERMPAKLRAGPGFLLGQLLARHGEHEAAALAFMRVPILHPRERELSAEALLAAAESLERANERQESLNCLRELLAEYPSSQAAAAAKTKIQTTPTGG